MRNVSTIHVGAARGVDVISGAYRYWMREWGPAFPSPFGKFTFGKQTAGTVSYSRGPAHGQGNDAFAGACVVPDGRVVLVPHSAGNVGLFDPSDDSYSNGPALAGLTKFAGSALLADGRVMFASYAHPYVGLFDPSDNSYTNGPAHEAGTSSNFLGATLLPDGRAMLVPFSAANVGLFDPSDSDSYEAGPAHGYAGAAFTTGCVLEDGRVIMAPALATKLGLFNPSDDSYADGLTAGYMAGTILIPDGRIALAPLVDPVFLIGLFDPSDDSYTYGPGEAGMTFVGGSLLPDGRTLLAPAYTHTNVGLYDYATNTYTSSVAHGEGNDAFRGSVLLHDGRVLLVPFDSDYIGLVDFGFGHIQPRSAVLHPLINKL